MGSLQVGAVVIGRNEAAHLPRGLASLRGECARVVYVDSGSSDDSVACARSAGARAVELDSAKPFTAARARNEGFAQVVLAWPEVGAVQFLDGDCELAAGWVASAVARLEAEPDVAAVCGMLTERSPKASLWNRLSALEWDAPAGETHSFGGIFMIRRSMLEQVGGFAADMIAGEDPELATRLRVANLRILRLGAPMAIHEAGLATASQWWRRMVRTGHSYAELAERHPDALGGYWSRRLHSIQFWGLALPLLALAIAFLHPLGLLSLPLGWGVLAQRVYRRNPRTNAGDAVLYAISCAVAKLPHAIGFLHFKRNRWRGLRSKLIEYKGPGAPR
jgi:GT2 family glycosyltransferase